MPRKNSLSHEEIARLPRGRRIAGRFFSLSIAPLPSGPAKISCVVSKKVSLKAVERNVVKRRCREAARTDLKTIEQPLALIFHAKKGAAQASFAEIRQDIEKLLQSAL